MDKKALTEILVKYGIITKGTETVVINVNSESICDIKVTTRIK